MSPNSILIAILAVTSTLAFGQSETSRPTDELSQHPYAPSKESQFSHPASPAPVLQSQTLDDPYRVITPSQRLRWFVTSTVGPAHMAGVAFASASGTAVNRPGEYGRHWGGFVNRLGIGMTGGATGSAMEAGIGLLVREDPRYFRTPQQAFKSRLGKVVTFTFLAHHEGGKAKPAVARYLGIVGSNFLSNFWRVHSEGNVRGAILRSSEGFGGRTVANAFTEFWPDVKRQVLRKHNRLGDGSRHD